MKKYIFLLSPFLLFSCIWEESYDSVISDVQKWIAKDFVYHAPSLIFDWENKWVAELWVDSEMGKAWITFWYESSLDFDTGMQSWYISPDFKVSSEYLWSSEDFAFNFALDYIINPNTWSAYFNLNEFASSGVQSLFSTPLIASLVAIPSSPEGETLDSYLASQFEKLDKSKWIEIKDDSLEMKVNTVDLLKKLQWKATLENILVLESEDSTDTHHQYKAKLNKESILEVLNIIATEFDSPNAPTIEDLKPLDDIVVDIKVEKDNTSNYWFVLYIAEEWKDSWSFSINNSADSFEIMFDSTEAKWGIKIDKMPNQEYKISYMQESNYWSGIEISFLYKKDGDNFSFELMKDSATLKSLLTAYWISSFDFNIKWMFDKKNISVDIPENTVTPEEYFQVLNEQ